MKGAATVGIPAPGNLAVYKRSRNSNFPTTGSTVLPYTGCRSWLARGHAVAFRTSYGFFSLYFVLPTRSLPRPALVHAIPGVDGAVSQSEGEGEPRVRVERALGAALDREHALARGVHLEGERLAVGGGAAERLARGEGESVAGRIERLLRLVVDAVTWGTP